jgi:hypothetical protein
MPSVQRIKAPRYTKDMMPFPPVAGPCPNNKIWTTFVRYDLENWAGTLRDPWSASVYLATPMREVWELWYPGIAIDFKANADPYSPWRVVQGKVSYIPPFSTRLI